MEEDFLEYAEEAVENDPGSASPVDLDAEPRTEDALIPSPASVVRYDPLQHYLAEVRRYPFLSREEERELVLRYRQSNDREAVSRLILSHLRFVVSIAMEYRQAPIPLMDLIQEGNLGLMMAVKKFDPARNTRVSTYAAWWIRAYILRYIMQNWRLVRMGTTQAQRKLFYNLRKEKSRLEDEGYAVSTKLLADRLDVKESEVVEMDRRLNNWDVSLDSSISPNGDEGLLRQVPSSDPPIDDAAADRDLKRIFREKLDVFRKGLKAGDRMLLDDRILSEEPRTLEAIGASLGISRERARQIEAKVIRNLRKFMKREMKDFDVIALGEFPRGKKESE